MAITEEQRQRAEANRLAALAKRKAFTESITNQQQQQQHHHNPWRLLKCRKLSSELASSTATTTTTTTTTRCSKSPPFVPVRPNSNTHLDKKFRVRLEICSPDSFSLTPEDIKGFVYPGEEECLRALNRCLSDVMPSHYTQNHGGGKACVYKLRDYDAVLSCLKNYTGIEIEKIPFGTLNVVQRLSHSFETGRWEPLRPEHLTDEKVDELIRKLPKKLLDALLPFQLDGLRFGLQRGGRCLIADEMGLGKTLQAIAIAGCFMNDGPILVVCPAILRFSWAEELERWLPSCLPSEIHLVFGHQNNPAYLRRCPRFVVISYKMLHHLRKSMLEREWALLIVDESHHVRCSKKRSEPNEIKAVLDVAVKVKHIVLLSGTPSLSRPGLLGQSKYDFAKTYCAVKYVQTSEGKRFQDFSKGIRLEELNMLLRQTVMIRRLKKHVLEQLPPKRRKIIRLLLKKSDISLAKAAVGTSNDDASEDSGSFCRSSQLSYHELGIAKLSGFREWLSIHPLISESDSLAELDVNPNPQKMIIFAHHLKVLDGVQELICEKGFGFVRIDGNTLAKDRQSAVLSFQSSNEVKVAIIGITAGGVGLDFSSAQNVVFLELPHCPSLMLQAEDRAHRRGQTNAVNIYIFCAKDTMDERHWRYLNKSLHRVSSTTNGKYDAVTGIAVDGVSYVETTVETEQSSHDQVSGKASYCELSVVELMDSGPAQDTQPFEIQDHDEAAGMLNHRSKEHCSSGASAVQTDDFHLKVEQANVVFDQELHDYFIASDNLARNVSVGEIGSQSGIFSFMFDKDKGSERKDQLEKEQRICPLTIESVRENEAYESFPSQLYSLRFEVSKYTGRIHLYSCILGTDSRPQPLFENFRPEELESLNSLVANDNHGTNSRSFKGNPAYTHALLEFINEWNNLRPIERRKLVGKTLQLPLSIELCYLNESINHSTEGLLKGGSKRRTTPLNEISYALPSNAVWKKVYLSGSYGKKEKQYTQGWTLMDEPLCKLCQTPCKGINAKAPEFFEDLFCNLSCYEEYRIRTSSRFLRQELFQIEHGVCTNCQLDCHHLVKTIKPLSLLRRREYIEKVAPNVASHKKLIDKLVSDPSEGNAWHADHIVPVYRGGGECRLENMRTLCVACHSDVTAAQRAERRLARAKARELLKSIMSNLKDGQDMKGTNGYCKGQGHSEMQVDINEDELLVKVPGSAYSGGTDPESNDLSKSSKAED